MAAKPGSRTCSILGKMACRPRSRLGSGAALCAAAAVLYGPSLRSQEGSSPQHIFASHPQVAPLQCASPPATSARPPVASTDRIPDATDVDAIVEARSSSIRPPVLPPDL